MRNMTSIKGEVNFEGVELYIDSHGHNVLSITITTCKWTSVYTKDFECIWETISLNSHLIFMFTFQRYFAM